MRAKTIRCVTVATSAALLLGAFGAMPADAKKKKKKCAAYSATGLGVDAETTVVTAAATEDAPVELTLTSGPGAGFSSTDPNSDPLPTTSHVFQNIQVDSKAASGNLYARVEFTPTWDYDVTLRDPYDAMVAYEGDFNPATVAGPTPVGSTSGAHAEPGVSQIDGYPALDCAGFTLDITSASTPGEDLTIKLWLD